MLHCDYYREAIRTTIVDTIRSHALPVIYRRFCSRKRLQRRIKLRLEDVLGSSNCKDENNHSRYLSQFTQKKAG